MAFNQANVLLVIALLVLAAVGPSSGGPLISGAMSPPPPVSPPAMSPPPPASPPAMSPPPPLPPTYKGLTVSGRVCCSPNGQCPGTGLPVGAATATLSCVGDCDIGVGHDEVDLNGEFVITIPSTKKLNFTSPFIPCYVTMKLPTILDGKNCEALSNTTGILASNVRSTGTEYVKALGGLVREGTITGFTKYSS